MILGPTHTSIHTALGTAAVMRAQAVNTALLGRFVPSPNALPAARGAWIEATDFLSQKRPFGSLGTAEGDHLGHEPSAAGQASVPMHLGDFTLTPAAGLRYAFFRGNSFNEDGAAAQNLAVGADTARSLQPYVSLKLDKAFGDAVRPVNVQLRLGNARELMGTGRQITVLSPDGTLFPAPGVALSRDYVTGGASVSFRPSKATIVSLGYDGLINTGHASAQSGYARFDYRFRATSGADRTKMARHHRFST